MRPLNNLKIEARQDHTKLIMMS